MQGHTYRYFKGDPLYPFGFGLSYTKFSYSNLKFSATQISAGQDLTTTAEVTNVGDRAGDEVVQLYIGDVAASVPVPIRALAGFQRVHLNPGEKQRVIFNLAPEQMTIVSNNGKRFIEPGEFEISIGGRQPDAKQTDLATVMGKFRVVGKAIEIPWTAR